MYGVPRTLGTWEVMLHGTVFGQFLYEPGDKHRTGGFSSRQVSSVNWLMAMARRRVGAGRVGLRTMASVEPWTVRECGFINLLASGEMCEGDTIHDRQHPHDLFMELAADYDRPAHEDRCAGRSMRDLAGEPALGPVGFPHRVSALPNPVAPITHHWLDSSHITFGLITTGLYRSALEGGDVGVQRARARRESRWIWTWPHSTRWPVASRSCRRLGWAVQVSAGHLHEAEAEFPPQPRSDVHAHHGVSDLPPTRRD